MLRYRYSPVEAAYMGIDIVGRDINPLVDRADLVKILRISA